MKYHIVDIYVKFIAQIFFSVGMCLTIADGAGGKRGISIHGLPGLDLFWTATQRFMYRPELTVNIRELRAHQTIMCKECVIHCFPLISEELSCRGISYICETPSKAGRMDISKAVALGVPKGPLLAKLKNGECIELSNGTIVTPSDVLDPSEPGRSAAIICSLRITELSGVICVENRVDSQSQMKSTSVERDIDLYLNSESWNR